MAFASERRTGPGIERYSNERPCLGDGLRNVWERLLAFRVLMPAPGLALFVFLAYDAGHMWRGITLMLLMYLALDFSDPNLPGALNFDLNQSVDGVQSQLRGQSSVTKISSAPAPIFVQDTAATKSAVALRPVIRIAHRPALEVRPRSLLSRVLRPDSSEAH